MKRARAVIAVAGITLTLVTGRAGSQAVTLPTIRTGKTAEMELLTQIVKAIEEPANQPSSLGSPADTLRFKCQLGAIALTPFTGKEIASADRFGETSAQTVKSFSFSQVAVPSLSDPASDRRLKNLGIARYLKEKVLTNRSSQMPDGLYEILSTIPASCGTLPELNQADVHQIVEPYREAETNELKKVRIDSLEAAADLNVTLRLLRERNWFIVRSHDEAVAFWKQPSSSALNIGAISGSNDQGATYTELGSRVLHAVRFSFSGVIASGKDPTPTDSSAVVTKSTNTSKDAASGTTISRFLNGGGLLNIAAALPIVHYGQSNGSADFLGVLAPRAGGTLPVMGSSQRDTTLMYDAGTEFMFKSLDDVGGLGLYFQTRIGFAGGTPTFMRLIGDGDHHHTAYQTVTGGITIDGQFVITMSKTISGPRSLQQTGWQLGVSMSRGASPAGGSQ